MVLGTSTIRRPRGPQSSKGLSGRRKSDAVHCCWLACHTIVVSSPRARWGYGMADVDELIEYEQPRVDEAYRIGELVLERLHKPLQAVHDGAAHALQPGRRERAEHLHDVLRDNDHLMVRGRVDFAENSRYAQDNGGRTFYIGIVHLTDYSDDDPQVVSWESDRAAAWRDPLRRGVGPDVARVLVFDGRERRLTDVQETKFRNGALEPGSIDPLLARLASTSSGVLTDVISTIQQDQFALMSRDPDQVMVVQGAPGTGKTIIGLHRVSVMLFRSGGEMTESDVLVVGPSSVFMDYVRGLLPSLGRGHVQQVEISAVGRPLDLRVTGHDSPAARRVKGSAVMAGVLRKYLDQRVGANMDPLKFDGVKTPLEQQVVDRVLRKSRADTRSYNDLRERLRENLVIEVVGRVESAQEEFLRSNRQALNNLLNRLVPTQSALEVVAGLLSSPKLLDRAADGLLDEAERAAIRRSETPLSDVAWTPDDVPLIDEAHWLLTGRGTGRTYRHVVVDEAQDLSPMQLRALKRRSGGGMTILGDLAQATSPWAPSTWADHLKRADIEIDHIEELLTGYRTVAPIVEFTNRMLPVINVDVPYAEALVREGEEPAVVHEKSLDSMVDLAVEFAEIISLDDDSPGRLGIIADTEELEAVASKLRTRDRSEDPLDWAWASKRLTSAITLVPADSAKGLEFDVVFVLEPSKLYDRDPVTGPRLLYLAMTRARHDLTLLHTRRLPAVLRDGPAADSDGEDARHDPRERDIDLVDPSAGDTDPSQAERTPTPSSVPPAAEDSSWSHVVSVTGGLVLVRVAGIDARIEKLPDGGGAPTPVAEGAAIESGNTIAWAIRDSAGAYAVTTPRDRAAAAHEVVRRTLER